MNYESKDKAINPSYYEGRYGTKVTDVIEDWTAPFYGKAAFDLGNVIKYILRYQHKNGLQDVEKAMWYATDLKNTDLTARDHAIKYSPVYVHENFFDILNGPDESMMAFKIIRGIPDLTMRAQKEDVTSEILIERIDNIIAEIQKLIDFLKEVEEVEDNYVEEK